VIKFSAFILFAFFLSLPSSAQLDQVLKGLGQAKSPDTPKIASGLKQALEVGTRNTVSKVGVTDGYFANPSIKIIMPVTLRPLEMSLRMLGEGPQIDSLILAMNRAAEKAAPGARSIFIDAITSMSFEDARGILTGGDTAATSYFKTKTSDKLRAAFQPVVESSLKEVGVVEKFDAFNKKVQAIPFRSKIEPFDINAYVVTKSLDGLFFVLGEEEKKIRTDPAAQVTPLLKDVFGKG